MNNTTVFGGWAVSPLVLKNVFGGDADYIDINYIMPKLFKAGQLKSDWANVVISECGLTDGNIPDVIAGWSSGAMFAYAAAQTFLSGKSHTLKKLILLSATPCFCRKDDFRFGARPFVIDQMITALNGDKFAVLQSFYERSGIEWNPDAIPNYTTGELSSGLTFLKQADLRPLAPLPIAPAFYHGKDDQIIPIAASKYFSEQTGGVHVEVDGGHAYFF